MRAVFVSVAIAVLGLAVHAPAAGASGVSDGWTDGSGIGAGASDGSASAASSGSSGKGSAPTCVYGELQDTDAQGADVLADRGGTLQRGDQPGNWFNRVCRDTGGNVVIADIIWIATAVNPVTLAHQALDYTALGTPQISLNPSSNQVQLVQLPIWLAIGNGSWKPLSASASAGGITVTTTATPTKMTWNMGDGNTQTCNGPGSVYNPSLPDAQQHSTPLRHAG